MTNITTTQTDLIAASSAIDLPTIGGWSTPLGKIGVSKPETRVAAFAAYMEANGGTSKEAYLKVRDALRAHLRAAETLQRARKSCERVFTADGQGASRERERIYTARIYDRRFITWLLATRAAGKAWSAQVKAEQRAAGINA